MSDPYADTSSIGASLWWVPAPPARHALESLIARLAHTHGTPAEAAAAATPSTTTRRGFPCFPPHVTVAFWRADEDEGAIVSAAAALADATPAFSVTLGPPAVGARYFQCVFAPVCDAEGCDGTLAAANAAVQARFGWANAYGPHLSLAYADLSPDAAEAVRADAASSGVLGGDGGGATLRIGSLELWDTRGPVEAWACMRVFPLRDGGGGGGGGGVGAGEAAGGAARRVE